MDREERLARRQAMREKLSEAYRMRRELERLSRKVCRIREEKERCLRITPSYEDTGGGSGGNGYENRLTTYLSDLMDYERECCDKLKELRECEADIERLIGKVSSPDSRHALLCRFVNHESWGDIACSMHFSEKRVKQLANAGLDELGERLPFFSLEVFDSTS